MTTVYSLAPPPVGLQEGDEWKSPKGYSPSFERVMRGGHWVDAQESDDGKQQESGAETGRQPGEVSGGAGESSPGDGNDGQVPGGGDQQPEGKADAGLTERDQIFANVFNQEFGGQSEEAGVDGSGSPVL